jgi:hypothetical protein
MILHWSYRLRRHLWAGVPLASWLGFFLFMAAVVAVIVGWPRPWLAVVLGLLLLGYLAVHIWASRRKYLRFEAAPRAAALLGSEPSGPPLSPDNLVPMRASGWFTVEGQDQYYIDLEADFQTVRTREHIVLARVQDSRFFLVGQWPKYELGWWYMFFQPSMMREVSVGQLHTRAHPQLALRIVHQVEDDEPQTIYLAFPDQAALRQVWDDLFHDAPPALNQRTSD